jgi:hypothetical protein
MVLRQYITTKWIQVALVVLLTLSLIVIQFGKAEAAQPDDWTTSYYVKTTDPNELYKLGYSLGQRDLNKAGTQKNGVILFLFTTLLLKYKLHDLDKKCCNSGSHQRPDRNPPHEYNPKNRSDYKAYDQLRIEL